MIQDILPLQFNNHYEEKEIREEDYVLAYDGARVLVKNNQENLEFLTYGECTRKEKEDYIYLFSIDTKQFFLYDTCKGAIVENEIADMGEWVTMQQIRTCYPKEAVFAVVTAYHLYVWYQNNRYCGKCGEKTTHDKKERMLFCNCCHNMIYPKIAPAVIVAVKNRNKLLLTKYANRTYKRYALIAGFTEIGETVEETVKREVMEEVGLQVKNIQYYKSQPWGFDSNLLLGFFCDVAEEQEITLDQEELACAEWVDREDIPEYKEGLSLTHEMMLVFKNGLER